MAISFFGDGGANQGIVHESMNLAAIWKLPVIFVCENNQYAESTPVEYATPIADIAERARGYNMPGVVVDGMDVFAVYDAAGTAIGQGAVPASGRRCWSARPTATTATRPSTTRRTTGRPRRKTRGRPATPSPASASA